MSARLRAWRRRMRERLIPIDLTFLRHGTVVPEPVPVPLSPPGPALPDELTRPRAVLPPPPSSVVMENLRAVLDPTLPASRQDRMMRALRAALRTWFMLHANLWIPEDTRTLVSSYLRRFREGLQQDRVVIESDVFYAGLVERMVDVNWTKATSREHAASELHAALSAALPQMVINARREATA